jgi:hypothetical protein
VKEGLGYLAFAALCLLAAWFAFRAGMPWLTWLCAVGAGGLGFVGARRL